MKPTDQSTVNSAQRTEELGYAGVNLGFGCCKLVLDGQPDCFMSALAPLSKGIEGLSGRTPEQRNIVRDNEGRQYEVGMNAVLSTTDEPLKVMSREWGRSKQYKLLRWPMQPACTCSPASRSSSSRPEPGLWTDCIPPR